MDWIGLDTDWVGSSACGLDRIGLFILSDYFGLHVSCSMVNATGINPNSVRNSR